VEAYRTFVEGVLPLTRMRPHVPQRRLAIATSIASASSQSSSDEPS
jgi:hypothetical protein